MNIENLIVELSSDPFNPILNFNVAVEYQRLNQTASAISFYLRCAEYGKDDPRSVDHVYASLLKLAQCFEEQNDRQTTVSNCLLQAIAYRPLRREGYFLLARFHERLGNWQECYTFANIGLAQETDAPLPADVEYLGEYCLRFESAISAYWIGRKQESLKMLRELSYESISLEYENAVKSNLERISA
jgi:hypothetical protein